MSAEGRRDLRRPRRLDDRGRPAARPRRRQPGAARLGDQRPRAGARRPARRTAAETVRIRSPRRWYPPRVGSPPARHVLLNREESARFTLTEAASHRPRWTARRVRGVRRIRARARRRPARLLQPLRAPAPRPGVGRDRHLRGRPHHDAARLGARLPGLRRGEAAGAGGRHGDRPRPLLDHRRRLLGERAAGLARRRPRAGPRPQRQPDQRGRALGRAEGARASPSAAPRTPRSSRRCSPPTTGSSSRTRSPT